jgi:hypothetical protein
MGRRFFTHAWKEENTMQIQGTAVGGRFAISDRGRDIGFIEGSRITFLGFVSPTDAAWAAWEADRSLELFRSGPPPGVEGPGAVSLELGPQPAVVVEGRGVIARLVPPADPEAGFDEWGFTVDLMPDDEGSPPISPEVFLRSRARRMWRGVRRSGLHQRMRQYTINDFTPSRRESNVIVTDRFTQHPVPRSGPAQPAAAASAPHRARAGTTLAHWHRRPRMAGQPGRARRGAVGGRLPDA